VSAPFKVVIPARFASSRLDGKSLLDIAGKPLIQHVYESAQNSKADQVIIATDDERIKMKVDSFGGHALMTDPGHKSGTDRIAEAVEILKIPGETVIVNVQGDEYACPPMIIDQVSHALQNNPGVLMATLCEKISDPDDLHNPNIVKVIFDINGKAIYFSRSPIPWSDPASGAPLSQPFRHIGIYAYRTEFLQIYTSLPHCSLEESEKLEQLRALYHGYPIHVEEACTRCGIGVDTPEDLERARQLAGSI